MELNFKGLEMHEWNVPTDRAQTVDEKNGVICLVVFVIRSLKCQKWLFFVFPADYSIKSVIVWVKY